MHFGMKVIAVRKNPDEKREKPGGMLQGTGDFSGSIPDCIVKPAELQEILQECDMVVLSVPYTSETIGLFGEKEIMAMKSSAFLINVARGHVVDEVTLLNALQNNKIAGAVLDTFVEEPLPGNSPFWDLPNVLITPHVAPNSSYYNDRASDIFAENLRRYLVGDTLVNVSINLEVTKKAIACLIYDWIIG